MPAAIKLQEEYPDDLQVVFVEVGDKPDAFVEAFTYDRKWRGGRAMWTKEPPFDVGERGIPAFALLDDDGEVLMKGITTARHHELVERIEERVKERGKGPEGAPDAVAKLWKEFRKGKHGKALEGAEALVADPGKKDADAVAAAAKSALETWRAELSAEIARAEWALANGRLDEAGDRLEALGKSLGGHGDLAEKVAALQQRLASPDLEAERKAAADLAKVESKMEEDGIEASMAKALEKVAEDHAGTKSAERAEHLARVVEAAGG